MLVTNKAQTFKTSSKLDIFLVSKNKSKKLKILNAFNIPDDKKGVDRASTVIARETNEGTVDSYVV